MRPPVVVQVVKEAVAEEAYVALGGFGRDFKTLRDGGAIDPRAGSKGRKLSTPFAQYRFLFFLRPSW